MFQSYSILRAFFTHGFCPLSPLDGRKKMFKVKVVPLDVTDYLLNFRTHF